MSPAHPDDVLLTVLASAREAMFVCDSTGRITTANGAAQELFGQAEPLVGSDAASLFARGSDLGLGLAAAARTTIELTTAVHGTVAVTHALLPGPEGDPKRLFVVHAASADSADPWGGERLTIALDAARLGDWSWDARTDIVTFSPRAAEVFGIPPGPHSTRSALIERLHQADREKALLAIEHAMAGRERYGVEYRIVGGGRERWVASSGRGRYGADGALLGMYGVVRDITTDRLLLRVDDTVRPLVEAEAIIETTARLLGEHLEVSRCAYAFVADDEDTFTMTGNYTSRVANVVGEYRFRQFGAECLRAMRAGESFVVEDAASDTRLETDDRTVYETMGIRGIVCVPILKSGRFAAAMAVHSSAPRAWSAGEVELVGRVAGRCWESIARGRVERERETLLRAAEAANRTKDEFFAMLGHELRNPLAPIRTALELMKLRGDKASERERTLIERQVVHLTRLVDDLLDVSRIAGGKFELAVDDVEISEIVSLALEVASPLLEQRAHEVKIDIPATGLLVEGDTARLVQVVSNLLTNAAKYTPPGGHIALAASADTDGVVLRVKDDGIGIPAHELPRIFDLFVQTKQSIDRAQGGLGLGLTIVKSIVERHGGTVRAQSDGPGKGTELVVRLPRSSPAVSAHRASPTPEVVSPALRARVLLVDDNEDAVEMLATLLEMKGCEVHVALDGAQALEIAATLVFDAALLDIGLPIMDGYELAARLRELPNLRHARLAAVTGYGQASDRAMALAAGFDHHLVKPVDISEIEKILAPLGAPKP